MISKAADGPVLLVMLINIFILMLVMLLFAGCATITDSKGDVIASSRSFGRDLEYSTFISFYESGATQSVAVTYTTRETVTGFLDSMNKIIGTAVAAAQQSMP